ncbi:MAG: hypothetical protein HZA68_03435 [Rhodovulum sp.]|nr:hypothetical protein [Rhodovulum sp.]
MTISRRILLGGALYGSAALAGSALAGSAWAGAAIAAASPSPAPSPRPPADVLVLVDPAAAPSFAAAAGRGGPVMLADGLPSLVAAAAWLGAEPHRRLVGFVSEAHGVLFRQMLPGAAAWLALGHHRVGGTGDHHSRHRLTVLPASRGIGRHLAAALAGEVADFSVTEAGIGAPDSTAGITALTPAASVRPIGWPARLGDLLGRVADGSWQPDPIAPPRTYAGRGSRGPGRDVALASLVVAG